MEVVKKDKSSIQYEIDGVQFDMYTKEYVRKNSVKQITESVAFDTLNCPNRGGLCDPALGVSVYDNKSPCVTCGHNSFNCSGHFGHIELPVVIYNPLMMKLVYKLLRAKCFNCHKLKLMERQKLYLYLKVLLIKLGYLKEASELHNLAFNSLPYSQSALDSKIINLLLKFKNLNLNIKYDEMEEEATTETYEMMENTTEEDTGTNDDENEDKSKKKKKKKKGGDTSVDKEEHKRRQEEFRKEIGEKIKQYKISKLEDIIKMINKPNSCESRGLDIQIQLKDFLKEFWKEVTQTKCPHCDYKSQKVKKQGFLKFFLMPHSKKEKKRLEKLGLNQNSAQKQKEDEEIKKKKKKEKQTDTTDSESDSDDEEISEKEMKFLNPIEVRDHINQLWERDYDLLDIVFGNIFPNMERNFEVKSTGAEIFFIENLIVTPNRFRPESKGMGGSDKNFLHQHTAIYTQILNISNQISLLGKEYNKAGSRELSSVNSPLKELKDSKENKDNKDNKDKNSNKKKRKASIDISQANEKNEKKEQDLKEKNSKEIFAKWIELQDAVNHLIDASKASKKSDQETTGIRQLLERKEGIFRMKMMGKRVNYAGRSVISPDPFIRADEVGIPLVIATNITYPEIVTDFNKEFLKSLILNGAFKWPGANIIEKVNGERIALSNVKDPFLSMHANKLCVGDIVSRHLRNDDALLVNRQPTLHRPSIMGHRARVLPGEKTIRLHYSNCNSYNADFDGDEMNIHLIQNPNGREEAYNICNTSNQYIVPTSGKPIRGLIQDSIVSAVFLTMKDTMMEKGDYFQLVYSALEGLLTRKQILNIELQPPTIYKPKFLWTGKQVVTTILKSLLTKPDIHKIFEGEYGMNMQHGTKLSGEVWGESNKLEGQVIVRDNELLTGVLDKNHIGNSEFGLIHAYYELYGADLAGDLISTFGKLFIHYLQFYHGFTCGVDDILLKDENNLKRRRDIENILSEGMSSLSGFFGVKNFKLHFDNFSNRNILITNKNEKQLQLDNFKMDPEERKEIETLINLQNFEIKPEIFEDKRKLLKDKNSNLSQEEKLRLENHKKIKDLGERFHESILKEDSQIIDANIDTVVKNSINQISSDCNKRWLKEGLIKRFPYNYFSLMVQTGAKGSVVNHTQVSCMLGQQELEGRRVPKMASGKTLPSFKSFDPNPRAGGFVSDRFSTGIRPQEFFFHCMAGREGLIDTAVKTSRSGYLQRCLVKHLEQLVVQYDYTVRDFDGNIIQFLYGEDSVDVTKTKYVEKFKFLNDNINSYFKKYKVDEVVNVLDTKSVRKYLSKKDENRDILLNKFPPWRFLGSVSEKLLSDMMNYIKTNQAQFQDKEEEKSFKLGVYLKYFNSLITPGENVGILAAQSVGEPSTQMTLNTFHLAGHGGANMTLGIPRLREILMTSENNIKTPFMYLPVKIHDKNKAEWLSRKFEKHNLIDIVKNIVVTRKILIESINNVKQKVYLINIQLEELNKINSYFDVNVDSVDFKLREIFLPKLAKSINKHRKQNKTRNELKIASKGEGKDKENNDEDKGKENNDEEETAYKMKSKKDKTDSDGEDEEKDEESGEEEGTNEDEDGDGTNEDGTIDMELDGLDGEGEGECDDAGEESEQQDKDIEIEPKSKVKVVESTKPSSAKKEKKQSQQRYDDLSITNIKLSNKNSTFSFILTIPLELKNLLIKNILDKELKSCVFTSVKGINKTFILNKKNKKGEPEFVLQLQGVNSNEIYKYKSDIDVDRIGTNDISFFLKNYGIEACRASIVNEINAVFDSYSISVDTRHLGLIADYITYQGFYRSFNRVGMEVASSPFLKMSFETSMNYMINSCTTKDVDDAKGSSSKIVLGLLPKVGTGVFSVLQSALK